MGESRKVEGYIPPMLATPVDKPFTDDEWIFELKLDGFRAIAEVGKNKLLFYSRNGLSFVSRFPRIAEALQQIQHKAVLDGEIVLLNERNRPDFQKLQYYEQNQQFPLVYYVFDLLALDGHDLKHLSLLERKELLKHLIKRNRILRYSEHIKKSGVAFFKKVAADDMEGIIAKRADSLYYPGVRSRDWLKIKNQKSQEAIIVGFTKPKGERNHFGSILLAQYKGKKLRYIGHAGTGFTQATLRELMQKMKPLVTARSPFDASLIISGDITWVKPKLVCEVRYTEITKDGMMRHPVYKGLRTEKRSKNIKQATERPKPVKQILHQKAK
jgi:bifunctional non-homologous end joining protein LigD